MALNDEEINVPSPPSPELDMSRHQDAHAKFSRDLADPDHSANTRVNYSSNRDNDTEEDFNLRYTGTKDIDKIERLYRRPKSAEPISHKDKMYRKIKKHSNMHNDRIEQFYKRPSSAKHVRNANRSNIITADIGSKNVHDLDNLKLANETSLLNTDTSKHINVQPMVATDNLETNDGSFINSEKETIKFEESSPQQSQSDNQDNGMLCSKFNITEIRSLENDDFDHLKNTNETSFSNSDNSKQIYVQSEVRTENEETIDDSLMNSKHNQELLEENYLQKPLYENQYEIKYCSNINTDIRSPNTDDFENIKNHKESSFFNTDTPQQINVRSVVAAKHLENIDDSLTYTKNDPEKMEENDLQKSQSDNQFDSTHCSNINTEIKSPNTKDFENIKPDQATSFSNTDTPQQMYVRSVDIVKQIYTKDGILENMENPPGKEEESFPNHLPSEIKYDSTCFSNIQTTNSSSSKTDPFENVKHDASIMTPNISKTIHVQPVVASQNVETCDSSLVNSNGNTEIIEENSKQHLRSNDQNDRSKPDNTGQLTDQNQMKPSAYGNAHLCDENMDEKNLQSTKNNINLEYHNTSQSSSQQDLRYVPFDSELDEQNFRERVYVHNVDCHVQTHKSPRDLDSHEKSRDEKDEPEIKGKFHTKSTGTFWQLSDKTSYSSNLDSLDRQQQDSESENQIKTTNSVLNEQTTNVIKPKQERKGRSRLRNIIIRKRNCVSPSPAKHEELSRRSRSCPAFYKKFNADNSDCSSCVCCINSVHPIEESKHSPHFDSLNELNKQNFTLLNYPDCLTSVCCKTSIHPVQEKRKSLPKFDSLDKLDSQTDIWDDSNCKSLICCKNSVNPIRDIGSMPQSGTHDLLESDSSCWDNSICTSSVCCKNSVVPIVTEALVNQIDDKSDGCSSFGDKTKSTSTLPTSETEEANGNNLPNVPDTTHFCQTDNNQTSSRNFALTDKKDINNSYSSKETCKENPMCTLTDSTEKKDISSKNKIDNYDFKRAELKQYSETAHHSTDNTMESSQKQENFPAKNLCKHNAINSDKSETNDFNFLCSSDTEHTENGHGIVQLAKQPHTILFSSASTNNKSNSQDLNCRYPILPKEQDISSDASFVTNENKKAQDKETRKKIKDDASKLLDLQTTVEHPDIVDRPYKRSPNTIDFETISEVGRSEDIDSKEVIKLGKKCRSISSANQERRRLGTPLTLILYVKKKCQSKIRKIMASKNNAAASKKTESQTQEIDNNANINIPKEETRALRKPLGVRECDSNGNNIKGNVVNKNCGTETKEKSVIDIESHQQNGTRGRQLTEEEMVRLESFSRLDPSTLRVIGWSSGASDSMSNTPDLAETQDDENMCKLTKVEFRRLQDQVRDVSFNLRNRFRTSAYQKLYQQPNPTPLENATQLYRSQLAASLRAFKPKEWPPLNSQELETSYLRCKPINCQNDSHSSPPTRCSARSRPKSVPPSAFRNRAQPKRSDTPTDVRPGNFDSLNPRVLSHLLNDTLTTSSYGEIAATYNQNGDESSSKTKDTKDDDVSTSGIESNPTDDTSSSDDEDDSDFEPEVDENRLAPELYLRPEKLDSLLLPDSAKGWRKFDFDADNVSYPYYPFSNPLPESFRELDMRQIARLKWNWRDQTRQRSREKGVDDILDRMVELERLQMETEDWEQKRSAQINKRYSKRAMSAKVPRDKRCCGKCLQPACTGDCPEKFVQSEICELCRQQFCVKTCADTKYEQRMRQSRLDDKIPVPKTPNPKYCKSCQTKHNAKLVNANNIVLGRPKSCNSTYSRGQASNKPKDYRPRSDTPVSIDMFQEFDKLGIDAQQPVRPTTAKVQRPRSRNSSFPSKSFYSQRRDSLTEADKHRFKKKSQKNSKVLVRRPKTAV